MLVMRHLMRYEGFTSIDRTDEILDKISKYGIRSLTKFEKDFLDSYKSGEEENFHDKLSKSEGETVFEDDNGLFKFEYESTDVYEDETHYFGTLYVPDLEWKSGKKIEGRLEGRIVVYSNGSTSPDFYSIQSDTKSGEHYDVFEFCNGLEYELDSFIDYVISELEKND